jgi:hypothetical protein
MGKLQSQNQIIRIAPGSAHCGAGYTEAVNARELHLRSALSGRLVGALANGSILGIALVLLLAAATGPARAQYKWKDSRGQVHVSDLPPPREIPDKDVLQRPGASTRPLISIAPVAAASTPAAARTPQDPELEARRKRAELEAKAQAKADEDRLAAQRAENCQRARELLATLGNGQRLIKLDAKGERVVLDDAARAQEEAQTRRVIAADCP